MSEEEKKQQEPVDPEVTDPKPDDSTPADDKKSEKTFTRAEMARITSAQVKDAMEKFQSEELPKLLEQAKTEGQKEAKMSADELAEQQAKQKEEDMKQREADLNRREAELDTTGLLTAKEVPEPLQKVLLKPLAEMKADDRDGAIDAIKQALSDAVQAEILKRTKGKQTPADGGASTGKAYTQEEWDALPYDKQADFFRQHPEEAAKYMNN